MACGMASVGGLPQKRAAEGPAAAPDMEAVVQVILGVRISATCSSSAPGQQCRECRASGGGWCPPAFEP